MTHRSGPCLFLLLYGGLAGCYAPDPAPDPAPDSGMRDLAVADPGTCVTSKLTDVPSRQRVTITVRNEAMADRYVVQAMYPPNAVCDPLRIDKLAGTTSTTLAISALPPPICEGPPPIMRFGVRLLKPGEVQTLGWDGRAVTPCTRYVDCSTRGWTGAGYFYEFPGQPMAAGTYRVTVYSQSVPPPCTGSGGDSLCEMRWPGLGIPTSACQLPSGVASSTEFTLSDSGDVAVDVKLK